MFMLHRIRVALRTGSFSKIGGSGSEVEVDETFVGGKLKNMHKENRPGIALSVAPLNSAGAAARPW